MPLYTEGAKWSDSLKYIFYSNKVQTITERRNHYKIYKQNDFHVIRRLYKSPVSGARKEVFNQISKVRRNAEEEMRGLAVTDWQHCNRKTPTWRERKFKKFATLFNYTSELLGLNETCGEFPKE